MHTLVQDWKLALREMNRRRGVTALLCGSLALAVLANTTVFSLVEALVLRPFAYQDPERLLLVWQQERSQPDQQVPVSSASFTDLRARAKSFAAIEAGRNASYNLTGGDQPELVPAFLSTPGMLGMLGMTTLEGRLFTAEEGLPGNDRVVILSHELWQRSFGGRPGIVGSTIQLDDQAYTVVGLLSPDTEFLTLNGGLWVPLALDPAKLSRSQPELLVMGRVAASTSVASAKAEIAAIGKQLEQEHPVALRGLGLEAVTLREQVPGETDRRLMTLLQGAMLFVLLIACANIANVLVARGQERQREVALRSALGAQRSQVVRQLLTESLVLATLGGLAGLGLSVVAIDILAKATASELPRMLRPELNATVVLFTTGVIALAGLIFGLISALESSRTDLVSSLKEGGRGSAGSRQRKRVTRALVVVEVTLALVMLCGAGLLVRSIQAVQQAEGGIDKQGLLTFALNLPASRYPADADVARFFETALPSFAALPSARAATLASALPRGRGVSEAPFSLPGAEPPADGQLPQTIWLAVAPSYFETLGIPLVAGRAFTGADRQGSAPVALVSASFAASHLAGASPIGRRLVLEGDELEIVGVVGDVLQQRLMQDEGKAPVVYRPHAQKPLRAMSLLIRSAGDPAALGDPVRVALRGLDPALPLGDLRTLEDHIARQFSGAQMISAITGGFGLVALLLSALGIYGVISYSVAQRRHEIGVHMAIGADRGRIVLQILRQGFTLTGLGLLLGVPGVVLVTRSIQALFQGALPVPISTLPLVGLILAGVAGLASYLPARRAASVAPVEALRGD